MPDSLHNERAMFLDPKTKDQGNIIRAVSAPASSIAMGPELRTRAPFENWSTFVRRNKTYPLAGILAALLVALLLEVVVTPKYRAAIQILIGPTDLRLVEKSVVPPAQNSDAFVMQVESETRILTSDR